MYKVGKLVSVFRRQQRLFVGVFVVDRQLIAVHVPQSLLQLRRQNNADTLLSLLYGVIRVNQDKNSAYNGDVYVYNDFRSVNR